MYPPPAVPPLSFRPPAGFIPTLRTSLSEVSSPSSCGFPCGGGNRWVLCGGDADGGLGGGKDGGGGEYIWDGYGYILSQWEDNVAKVTLSTEPNDTLDYALGLAHHHPIMSTIGEPGGRLEREIEIEIYRGILQVHSVI